MPGRLLPDATRDRLLAEYDSQPLFDSATFNCFLAKGSMRFLVDGELSVTFIIPPVDTTEEALSLRYLVSNPLPLTITVKVTDAYHRDKEESETQLREVS
jgi:hypothetical protein